MPMVLEFVIFSVGLAVYAGYGAAGLAYLTAATVFAYAAGRLIPRFPWVMWVSVAANALALLLVKLQPVTAMELPAILGISYLTLKVISYHVDLYRGKYPPEENFLRIGLYVTYLPQLFLGPIERYDRFRVAAFEERNINWEGISAGGARILWGLFKKLVIAARAGMVVSGITADPAAYRGPFALAAMVMYYLQLYADFSGGIDVIIGISRMLGIRVSENFRMPYLAESVQEFWRRWHITLGSWLREYVYIPLGGNRKGNLRKAVNLLITFLVSGLWHGVHYLVWGLLNGLFAAVGEKCKTKSPCLNRIGTFLVISFLWAFFVWPDTATALEMIGSVFVLDNYGSFWSQFPLMSLDVSDWLVLGAAVGMLFAGDAFWDEMGRRYRKMEPAGHLAVICTLGLLILVFGVYGIGFDVEAFIYSRF